MGEKTYRVLDCDDNIMAENMVLDNALLFLKALFEKYYMEPTLQFRLEREYKGGFNEEL